MKRKILGAFTLATAMGVLGIYSMPNAPKMLNSNINNKNENSQESINKIHLKDMLALLNDVRDDMKFGGTSAQGYIKANEMQNGQQGWSYVDKNMYKIVVNVGATNEEELNDSNLWMDYFAVHNLKNNDKLAITLVLSKGELFVDPEIPKVFRTVSALPEPFGVVLNAETIDKALENIELEFVGTNLHGSIADNPRLNRQNIQYDRFSFVVGWWETQLWPSEFIDYKKINDLFNGLNVHIQVKITAGGFLDQPLKTWSKKFVVSSLSPDPGVSTVDKLLPQNLLNLLTLTFSGFDGSGTINENTILNKKYIGFYWTYMLKISKEDDWSNIHEDTSVYSISNLRNGSQIKIIPKLYPEFNWLNDSPAMPIIIAAKDLGYNGSYFLPRKDMVDLFGKLPNYDIRPFEAASYDGAYDGGHYYPKMHNEASFSNWRDSLINGWNNGAIDPALMTDQMIEQIKKTRLIKQKDEYDQTAPYYASRGQSKYEGYGQFFLGNLEKNGAGTQLSQSEIITGNASSTNMSVTASKRTSKSTSDGTSLDWQIGGSLELMGKYVGGNLGVSYSKSTTEDHKSTDTLDIKEQVEYDTLSNEKSYRISQKLLGGWYDGYLFIHNYKYAIPWRSLISSPTTKDRTLYGLEARDNLPIPNYVKADDELRLATNSLPYESNEMTITPGTIPIGTFDTSPNINLSDFISKAKQNETLNSKWFKKPENIWIKDRLIAQPFELYTYDTYDGIPLLEYTKKTNQKGFFIGNNQKVAPIVKEISPTIGPASLSYGSTNSHTESNGETYTTTWAGTGGIKIAGIFSISGQVSESSTTGWEESAMDSFSNNISFDIKEGNIGKFIQRRSDDLFGGYLFWRDKNSTWRATPWDANVYSDEAQYNGITTFWTSSQGAK